MRSLVLSLAAPLLLLAPSALWAQQQETPQQIVERAIAAHGGKERLARVRSDRVRISGTLHVGGGSAVAFSNETTIQLPTRFKSVVRITVGKREQTVVHLFDGEHAAILVDGTAQPVSSVHIAQMRQTLQLDHVLRLVPLLADSEFHLAAIGEATINGRPAVGIRVTGHGQRDVRLYFDRPSGLLVKSEQTLDGPAGKDVRHEAYYSGYRDLGGYRRPGKIVAFRDGNKVMEADLISAIPLDHVDPAEFTRP
jgi:hypothetical protein